MNTIFSGWFQNRTGKIVHYRLRRTVGSRDGERVWRGKRPFTTPLTALTGSVVVTVPDRFQVDLGVLREILAQLDGRYDVVVTRGQPRCDPWPNRIRSRAFHWLIGQLVSEQRFQ